MQIYDNNHKNKCLVLIFKIKVMHVGTVYWKVLSNVAPILTELKVKKLSPCHNNNIIQ